MPNKAKDYFYELYPDAKKNWWRDSILYTESKLGPTPGKEAELKELLINLEQTDLKFSNFHPINGILRRFHEFLPEEFKLMLDDTYVGLLDRIPEADEGHPGAFAVHRADNKNLILLNFKFILIWDLLGEIFARVALYLIGKFPPQGAKQVTDLEMQALRDDILNGLKQWNFLSVHAKTKTPDTQKVMQVDWQVRDIKTFPRFIPVHAAGYKFGSMAFSLWHEIAHHQLGHTKKKSESLIDALPPEITTWSNDKNESHKKEFSADSYAAQMLLSELLFKNEQKLQVLATPVHELGTGALMLFLILGAFKPDPRLEGKSHPSLTRRFTNVANIAKLHFDEKTYQNTKMIVTTFIEFLEQVGVPHVNVFKAFP